MEDYKISRLKMLGLETLERRRLIWTTLFTLRGSIQNVQNNINKNKTEQTEQKRDATQCAQCDENDDDDDDRSCQVAHNKAATS